MAASAVTKQHSSVTDCPRLLSCGGACSACQQVDELPDSTLGFHTAGAKRLPGWLPVLLTISLPGTG